MANGSGSGGVGFLGLLGVLFIGLKLAGLIDWSWWAVLLPVWGPFAVSGAFLVVYFLVALAAEVRRRSRDGR